MYTSVTLSKEEHNALTEQFPRRVHFYEHIYDRADIINFHFRYRDNALVTHPELLREIFHTQYTKFRKASIARKLFATFTEDGVQVVHGEEWEWQHSLLQPIFHSSRINNYIEHFERVFEQQKNTWQHSINWSQAAARYTLAVSAYSLVGIQNIELDMFIETIRSMTHDMFGRYYLLCLSPLGPYYGRWRRRKLDQTIFQAIADGKKGNADDGTILAALIEAQKNDSRLTDQGIRNQIATFLAAGYETSSHTLAWCAYLLDQHPEYIEKIRGEFNQVVGQGNITPENIDDLKITQQVIYETLRLYPISWSIDRVALEEIDLGGQILQPGKRVLTSFYTLHRHPDYYPEPHAFKPERWADGISSKTRSYQYLPFSNGARSCMGSRFAMMEMTVAIARLCHHFNFSVSIENIEFEKMGFLRPVTPFHMTLEPR